MEAHAEVVDQTPWAPAPSRGTASRWTSLRELVTLLPPASLVLFLLQAATRHDAGASSSSAGW